MFCFILYLYKLQCHFLSFCDNFSFLYIKYNKFFFVCQYIYIKRFIFFITFLLFLCYFLVTIGYFTIKWNKRFHYYSYSKSVCICFNFQFSYNFRLFLSQNSFNFFNFCKSRRFIQPIIVSSSPEIKYRSVVI